jgi:hypothetical protein
MFFSVTNLVILPSAGACATAGAAASNAHNNPLPEP